MAFTDKRGFRFASLAEARRIRRRTIVRSIREYAIVSGAFLLLGLSGAGFTLWLGGMATSLTTTQSQK